MQGRISSRRGSIARSRSKQISSFGKSVSPPAVQTALAFPSNGASPSTANISIYYANPQSNGLPMWGPSNAGVTIFRQVRGKANAGYVARFWYSVGDPSQAGNADFVSNSNSYWGGHPYPYTGTYPSGSPGGDSVTTHLEEIAAQGNDFLANINGNGIPVDIGNWIYQAIRVTYNGDNTKTITYYTNLSNITNDTTIVVDLPTYYGTSEPANPHITIGESPWYNVFQHERGACDMRNILIFNADIGEAGVLSQYAARDSASLGATGAANIWWGKRNPTTNDLTCDFGTGRSFSHGDASNKVPYITL